MNATIELDLLLPFVAVAEAASFSVAADRLGVSKGTVSRKIARLERRVGAELLHRTTRRVALSTAGAALYERAAPHLSALQRAVGSLPEREEQPSGELRITAPTDFGVVMLPDIVARFTMRYPGVRVDVHLGQRAVDLVAEGFDLAIRGAGGRLRDSSLAMRRLSPVEFLAYSSPFYVARRGAPKQIGEDGHDWIGFRPALRQLGFPAGLRPRIAGDDFFFVREAIRAGGGIGVLPTYVAEPLAKIGELVRVLSGFRVQTSGLVLLYPSSGTLARKVVAFRDLLVETLKTRRMG